MFQPDRSARRRASLILATCVLTLTPAVMQSASSTLTLAAGAVATIRPAGVQVKGPQQVPLAPGSQVCVSAGSASVSDGGVRRSVAPGRCYQLPAPQSVLGSLLSVAQSWLPKSRQASTVNAESRAGVTCGESTPGIALPRDYPLPTLLIPVSLPPEPTLVLYGRQNQPLYSQQENRPGMGFEVPVAHLRRSSRVVIRDAFGDLIYSGSVSVVDFPSSARGTTPTVLNDRARQLLDTGLPEYLVPAYSLLSHTGESQAAGALLDKAIRVCFVSPTPT
ncbi:hypothetical protein LAJ19_15040 (plasmid) [Deinococcus taeanensis]|uniref:hypothetical protein n=1 Tax=Deinococcus taeanensis TaxID=2737050 RepID=UPI001CDB731D|nr:hypothetical protein [Deinococcus taeanensis]UBV44121.1 hypothetical protein LAJ19_15040 [Deinococcus taeanensis]